MRAVVQRVTGASVMVGDDLVGSIDTGLLVLLGIGEHDDDASVEWMVRKIAGLRIFADDDGAMNLDVAAVEGGVLVVSQFTLLGDARRGNRPSFVAAASPEIAVELCDAVAEGLRDRGLIVETGRFRAHMQVRSTNDGPVTIILEHPSSAASEDGSAREPAGEDLDPA